MSKVKDAWGLGSVNRWHTNTNPNLRNSGDTNDAHVARMLNMLDVFHPDPSLSLRLAIQYHDAPEKRLGDMPGPSKTGGFGRAYSDNEAEEFSENNWPQAKCEIDKKWVSFLDKADAYLFAMNCDKSLANSPEWSNMQRRVSGMARELGVWDKWVKLI